MRIDVALRLRRIVAGLAPRELEVHGLVALMELQASRLRARTGAKGEPILLLDLDRSRWDRLLIGRGLQALDRVRDLAEAPGPYRPQAELAACHARALHPEQTDWSQIAAIYAILAATTKPSPVVELNRAVAVGMADGPAAGLHADDTTVPILANGKTDTGRIWTYVRDDRPFGGADPPAALYYASRDRRHEHPDDHLKNWRGVPQADAYGGYNGLYDPTRKAGAVTSALCWAHARRGFFELADISASARRGPSAAPVSPIALEAVKRIDALFEIERAINRLSPEDRQRVRQEQSRPLVDDLHAWLQSKRAALSRSSSVASTTCSSAGAASPASSTTGASA
jgi:hypothetical protein